MFVSPSLSLSFSRNSNFLTIEKKETQLKALSENLQCCFRELCNLSSKTTEIKAVSYISSFIFSRVSLTFFCFLKISFFPLLGNLFLYLSLCVHDRKTVFQKFHSKCGPIHDILTLFSQFLSTVISFSCTRFLLDFYRSNFSLVSLKFHWLSNFITYLDFLHVNNHFNFISWISFQIEKNYSSFRLRRVCVLHRQWSQT